jgi:hypothetical protein
MLQGTAVTLELEASDIGQSHHVTLIRAVDYSPDTLSAITCDDVNEHDWSEKT